MLLTSFHSQTWPLHTDLMKWPCLTVKACQQHKYLIVLYIEKLLKLKEILVCEQGILFQTFLGIDWHN